MPARTLKPGTCFVCEASPVQLRAEVGMGVVLCAFDPETTIGGACYFPPTHSPSTPQTSNLLRQFLRDLKEKGARREGLRLKLLGATETLLPHERADSINNELTPPDVAHALSEFGLRAHASAPAGRDAIAIEFSCESGEVRFRRLQQQQQQQQQRKKATPPVPKRLGPIKVLLVDDSAPIRMLLRTILENDGGFSIIGEAATLREAEELRTTKNPDVISLDLHMPDGNGADFVKRYMSSSPTPTVLVTGFADSDRKNVVEALEAGVFEVLGKPVASDFAQYSSEFVATLRAATKSHSHIHKQIHKITSGLLGGKETFNNALLLLGASTGGTEALFDVLTALPENVPPILVVQHIPPVFSRAFAERLNLHCAFRVKEAENEDEVLAGRCYVAAGGKHLKLRDAGGKFRLLLTDDPPVNRFRPSVDYMFNSVADVLEKRTSLRIVASLLTGMGDDGADGMVRLRKLGAATIAQDESSSVVFGMPKMAIERGGAKHIASLDTMPELIVKLLKKNSSNEAKSAQRKSNEAAT